jgi:hypothetical protein
MDLLDMGGVIMDKDVAPLRAAFQESLLSTPGGRIAAGTDEILRNIIAERVLGLPQDVRVDRDLPFDQLPTGRGLGGGLRPPSEPPPRNGIARAKPALDSGLLAH